MHPRIGLQKAGPYFSVLDAAVGAAGFTSIHRVLEGANPTSAILLDGEETTLKPKPDTSISGYASRFASEFSHPNTQSLCENPVPCSHRYSDCLDGLCEF